MKVLKLEEVNVKKLAQRRQRLTKARSKVMDILEAVRTKGDEAVLELTKRFDKADLKDLKVTREEVDAAVERVPKNVKDALAECIENVRTFHRSQWSTPAEFRRGGLELGRIYVPLDSVGIYVPGGKASYPSTVIMASIPARTAGVKTIVVCTPPDKDGNISDVVLCAASMCGVTDIFKAGGAQAIAAMAYGTRTVPKVEKIVGPGNIYVVAAKELVREVVGVDFVAGPSEILIVADENANPAYVAADIIAQAEHDEEAFCVLCTPSMDLVKKVQKEVQEQLKASGRLQIISKALEKNGHIIITKDIDGALDLSNAIAPEHLSLMVRSPKRYLDKVKNAGSVFLGDYSAVAAGDYCTGPNHILPTGGQAREISGLSVDDFFKRIYYQSVSKEELRRLSRTIMTMADVEGLGAHKASIEKRIGKDQGKDNGRPVNSPEVRKRAKEGQK
jgi:histidinol dehydrogenase